MSVTTGRLAGPGVDDHYSYRGSGEPGSKDQMTVGGSFAFHTKSEPIDWKRIAAIDVEATARTMDIRVLQDNIKNIAYCSIESEIDTRTVDPNFVKLFKLAQLIVEYLLHCQDYLTDTIVTLEEQLKAAAQDHAETRRLVEKLRVDVSLAKKESHRRKKMLAQQQMVLDAGSANYHKCWQCPKAFLNATFLQNHMQRRHSLHAAVPAAAVAAAALPGSKPADRRDGVGAPAGARAAAVGPQLVPVGVAALEAEIGDIREQLQLSQAQMLEERRSLRATLAKEQEESERRERELHDKMEDMRKERDAAHRTELQRVQDMFTRELRETNEKHRAAEQSLADLRLQLSVKRSSTLGTLSDDFDVAKEKEELQKEREALSKIRADLSKQVAGVTQAMEVTLAQQETQWKEKMTDLARHHELELAELRSSMAASGGARDQRREGAAAARTAAGPAAGGEAKETFAPQQQQPVAYQQRIAALEAENREQQRLLQKKDADIQMLVQRPPPVAPRSRDDEGWPSSISITDEPPAAPPAQPPKTKMLQFKDDGRGRATVEAEASVVPAPTQQRSLQTSLGKVGDHDGSSGSSSAGEEEEDGDEDDEADTVRPGWSRSAMTDEASSLQSSAPLERTTDSTGTLDAGSTLAGLTADSKQLRQALLSNPQLMSQMRYDLQQLLDRELSQRGINPKSLTLPMKQFEDKMTRLALERQQKAKKFATFTQIRKDVEQQVNKLAAERSRASRQTSVPSSSREGTLLTTASRGSNSNNNNYPSNGGRTPREQQAAMEASRTLSSFGTASSQWVTSTADSTMRTSDDSATTAADLTGGSLQLDSLLRRHVEDALRLEQEGAVQQELPSSSQQRQQLSYAGSAQQQQQQQQSALPPPRQKQAQPSTPATNQQREPPREQHDALQWSRGQQLQQVPVTATVPAASAGPALQARQVNLDESWDSDEVSDLEEISPAAGRAAAMPTSSKPVTIPVGKTVPPKHATSASPNSTGEVARLAASIEAQLMSRSGASKPVNGIDTLRTSPSARVTGSPTTPEIPQLNDDSDDYSLTSNEDDEPVIRKSSGSAPSPAALVPQRARQPSSGDTEVSTNTFGTSIWSQSGTVSSKASPHAAAAAAPGAAAGRTSGPASLASDAGSLTTVTGASAAGQNRGRTGDWTDSEDDISDL